MNKDPGTRLDLRLSPRGPTNQFSQAHAPCRDGLILVPNFDRDVEPPQALQYTILHHIKVFCSWEEKEPQNMLSWRTMLTEMRTRSR